MTVAEAIEAIRREGSIQSDGDRIRVRIAEAAKASLQPAIETLRREKSSALQMLGSTEYGSEIAAGSPEGLRNALRGRALELWSDSAGGRLFIVADDADTARLRERRGEVLTVDELELVVRIEDPATAVEVLRWKRAFDGVLSGCWESKRPSQQIRQEKATSRNGEPNEPTR